MTALLVLVIAVVTVVVVTTRSAEADSSDVFLASANEVGPDPFTPDAATTTAGSGTQPAQQATATNPTTPPASDGGQRSYNGGQPGLYGGTRNEASCDAQKMRTYLDQHPDKKSAWAAVEGISSNEVRSYVEQLTPVLLRTDTLVVNHGFANGQATRIDVVLQAGTAVMIDKYGVPRVKCSCGNPLLPPTRTSQPSKPWRPVWRGSPWASFNPRTVVIIQKTTIVINEFIVIDRVTNQPFRRLPGSVGDAPGGVANTPVSSTTSTVPPTTAPPPTAPGTLPLAPPTTGPTDYDLPERPVPDDHGDHPGSGYPDPEYPDPHLPDPGAPSMPQHTIPPTTQVDQHHSGDPHQHAPDTTADPNSDYGIDFD